MYMKNCNQQFEKIEWTLYLWIFGKICEINTH